MGSSKQLRSKILIPLERIVLSGTGRQWEE